MSITVPANTSGSTNSITVRFICTEGGCNVALTITQEFSEPKAELKVSGYDENWDFEGGTDTLTVVSNYPWTTITDGVTVNPTSGNAGTTQVLVTVPKNETKEAKTGLLTISAKGIVSSAIESFTYEIMSPYLNYGGEYYALAKMKDGNIWMAENLRYVPAGKSVSDDLTALDNGLWYPEKINNDGTSAEFDKSTEGIGAKGYLYTTATAFGVARGTITDSTAASFEGCQGICPKGWHIPTVTEMVNLVGKCNTAALTKTDAPYYDPNLGTGSGSIALLEADKWTVKSAVAGMMQVNKLADTTAVYGGTVGTPKTLNTGYFVGSSFYKKTTSNIQFYGLMPSVKNGNISAGYNNITNGVSVRCIKDVKK